MNEQIIIVLTVLLLSGLILFLVVLRRIHIKREDDIREGEPFVEFEYTVGGVSRTERSLENLMKRSIKFYVRAGNAEEKIKALKEQRAKQSGESDIQGLPRKSETEGRSNV